MASTTAPSATSVSASLLPTPTSTSCGATLYDIPAAGAACAMPFGGNNTAILSACCGDSADVVSYADDCGVYCLAEGQTVDELTACMFQNGAPYAEVFCSGAGNATADSSAGDAPLSSGASVVATAADATGASATESGAAATGSGEAESMAAGRVGMGVTDLAVSALVLTSMLFGALRL